MYVQPPLSTTPPLSTHRGWTSSTAACCHLLSYALPGITPPWPVLQTWSIMELLWNWNCHVASAIFLGEVPIFVVVNSPLFRSSQSLSGLQVRSRLPASGCMVQGGDSPVRFVDQHMNTIDMYIYLIYIYYIYMYIYVIILIICLPWVAFGCLWWVDLKEIYRKQTKTHGPWIRDVGGSPISFVNHLNPYWPRSRNYCSFLLHMCLLWR